MKTTLKDSAPCEKVLSVSVSEDLIRDEYAAFFQKVAPRARVPGFRPGRAPREVLEGHYRNEAREEVLENLISRSFREALQAEKIEFLGRPTICEVQFTDERLTYEAHLEVPPEIKLRKYKGLACERKAIEIKPEEVEEALQQVRESHAKFVAVEDGPAAMGHFLIADYTCSVDGKEVENRTDDWFELKEEEFLKGFSSQLTGVRAGETREVRITFPEKFGRKEWAGKEGLFRVHVKEIKEKRLPPLDDELAKETGEFGTLEELRGKLRGQIEARHEREAETEFEKALIRTLIQENPFEVPRGVVDRRTAHLVEQALQTFYQPKDFPQEMAEKEAKRLFEKFRPEAEREVRISFLLEAIAQKEKIELHESDFEAKYKETASRHRQAPEAVKKYYAEHPEAKETLRLQILNEKALGFVKDQTRRTP